MAKENFLFSIENSDSTSHIKVRILGIKFNFKKKNINKVIFTVNGKEKKHCSIPRGLKLELNGKNNIVIIDKSIKFSNAQITINGDDNILSVKSTPEPIKDVIIFVEDGSEVYIDENASIGQGNFYLVANGNYKEKHKIVIGKNFRAARDTIIRTSDGHSLIDPETNLAINEPKDIIIGDNVWVMSRCMIAKGAKIPDGSAVAAYSFVNKPFEEKNILLAGIPAKILKHNIRWNISSYGSYMRSMEENIKE